jgi:hypothetical protein
MNRATIQATLCGFSSLKNLARLAGTIRLPDERFLCSATLQSSLTNTAYLHTFRTFPLHRPHADRVPTHEECL